MCGSVTSACIVQWGTLVIQLDLSSVKNLQVRKLYGDETKLGPQNRSETHVCGSVRKRLRKQTLIVRSRKGLGRRSHDEFVFAETPRKQNQLTNHPRKLKLSSRKTSRIRRINDITPVPLAQWIGRTMV